MEKKEKSRYISSIKVIATICVVFVHSENLLGYASYTDENTLIYFFSIFSSAGVPLFFAAAGYLLFRSECSWRQNTKKKIRSLVIPFLFWNTVWLAFDVIGECILPAYFNVQFTNNIYSFIDIYFGIPFYTSPHYVPLWFVRDLFILNLAAPLFQSVLRFQQPVVLCFLCIIWLLPIPSYFSAAVVFFALGGVLAKKPICISNRAARGIFAITTVAILIAVVVPGRNTSFMFRQILTLIAVISVSTGLLTIQETSVLKIMVNLLPYSLPIYLLHGKLLSVMQILYVKLIPTSGISITVGYLAMPVIIVVVTSAIAKVMQYLMPRIYRISIGYR